MSKYVTPIHELLVERRAPARSSNPVPRLVARAMLENIWQMEASVKRLKRDLTRAKACLMAYGLDLPPRELDLP